MNANDFFEDLEAQNWQKDINSKVSYKFDELIEMLQSEKESIIEETLEDLSKIEKILEEDNKEYTHQAFKKWMNKIIKENITSHLDE